MIERGTTRSISVDISTISSIPENAREENVTQKHGAGGGKLVKNYYLGRSYVGKRVYKDDGQLEYACSYKNGKRHGWEFNWNEEGGLSDALPYSNGIEYGRASVWGSSGRFLALTQWSTEEG